MRDICLHICHKDPDYAQHPRALYDLNPEFRGIDLTLPIFEEVFQQQSIEFRDFNFRFFEIYFFECFQYKRI